MAPAEPPASGKTNGPKPASTRKRSRRRGGLRTGSLAAEVRYFVGRPADSDGKPALEQEVASEPEALVIAFKNDTRVYFLTEYRVTQRIEGGQVRLEKEPALPAQRVSTSAQVE